MAEYDRYYQEEHYFGKPYAGLLDFFRAAKRGSVADLGAGQGRDSLALAAMGYTVTAVDVSSVGLAQISAANPGIQTVTGDLHSFAVSGFDYVLLDSMLHFYKRDIETETALVRSLLAQMKPGAVFVNCLLRNKAAEKRLRGILGEFPADIMLDTYTDYPEFNATYHLLAARKREADDASASAI